MNGDMSITTSLFFDNGDGGAADDLAGGEEGDKDDDNAFNEAEYFAEPSLANQIGIDPILTGFMPAEDSPVAETGLMIADNFFVATDYIGAFDPKGTDWTMGWTTFVTE